MDYTFLGAGFNKVNNEQANSNTSINVRNNTGKAQGAGAAYGASFENVIVSGMSVDRQKLDDNTYKSLIKDADNVKSQIMESASNAKIGLKALFNRLNGMDVVRIDEDGFNLTDATPEDMVNIVDRIKIELAMSCENYQMVGSGVSLEQIEQVVGSKSFASEIAGRMSASNVPVNEENTDEVAKALEKVSRQNGHISEQAKNYMVANNIEPTIDNMATAEHCVNQDSNQSNNQRTLTQREWEQLEPQIKKMLGECGLEVNIKNLNNARTFIESGIPVTAKNLVYKAKLDAADLSLEVMSEKIVDNMAIGERAEDAYVTDSINVIKEVTDALNVVTKISVDDIGQVGLATDNSTLSGEPVSLQSIDEAYGDLKHKQNTYYNPNDSEQTKENKKALLQVQILLTANSGVYLAKSGISINSVSINYLHKQLLAYDREQLCEKIETQLTDREYEMLLETREALFEIKNSPDDTIGAILSGDDSDGRVTLRNFVYTGGNIREKYRRANEAYHALGTTVRGDLGDSYNKAFNTSVDDILTDLALEHSQANKDAVRILGYNSMEITPSSIMEVKELYQTLTGVIERMRPEQVYEMIRDNINPMDTDIHILYDYLKAKNIDTKSEDYDKYAMFLYKLDKTSGIDPKQRQQFIGIFKMMNMFSKDAGSAIGTLVNQGAAVTMENLCMAYASRKYRGTEVIIDDSTNLVGMKAENYFTNLFDNNTRSITPLTLKTVDDEKAINTRTVEEFCEATAECYDSEEEAKYFEDYVNELRKAADAEMAVLRELENAGQDFTLNNIEAMKYLMQSDSYSKLFGKNRNRVNEFVEKMDNGEEFDAEFDKLNEEAKESVDVAVSKDAFAKTGVSSGYTDTYEEFKNLQIVSNQINMINKLSKKHDYNVPYLTEDGVGMIKLTLVQDEDTKGRISVSFESQEFGQVSVEAKVSAYDIQLFGVCNTDSDVLKAKLDNISQIICDEFSIKKSRVYCGDSNVVGRITYDSADKKRSNNDLYRMSKIIITNLI